VSIDPYAQCPCGSGKKFKWCCQPYHPDVVKAFEAVENGQPEIAEKLIGQLVKQYANNPVLQVRHAQLLARQQRFEQAEQALDRALELDPHHAFAHYVRGMLRLGEGEIIGALMLFRRAAEFCVPEATEHLSQVLQSIAECELKLNRPVAARAALAAAVVLTPKDGELQQTFENLFGEPPQPPACARKPYRLRDLPADLPPPLRKLQQEAAALVPRGRFAAACQLLAQISDAQPDQPSACFNHGLVLAYLGESAGALTQLARSLERETDEQRATETAALMEVLRCGHGADTPNDHETHQVFLSIRDPQRVVRLMQDYERQGRILGAQLRQETGTLEGIFTVARPSLVVTADQQHYALHGAYFLIAGPEMLLFRNNQALLRQLVSELLSSSDGALVETRSRRVPCNFGDVLLDAILFPAKPNLTALEVQVKRREYAQQYFEEQWINQPRHSLDGLTPAAAAQTPIGRKRLLGVIQFIADCAEGYHRGVGEAAGQLYDFDRLRRRLGLAGAQPPADLTSDISGLTADQLAQLPIDALTLGQLEEAFRAAMGHKQAELAARFALAATRAPIDPARADRYPYFAYLARQALSHNQFEVALELLQQGEADDRTHNGGQRASDYLLQRGQVLTRRADPPAAEATFAELLQREPTNLRAHGSAVEAMIALGQKHRATEWAELGLAEARKQNNRDGEEYFLELLDAADRL
jgi:tetratricopeptide (TPR) repeat protein